MSEICGTAPEGGGGWLGGCSGEAAVCRAGRWRVYIWRQRRGSPRAEDGSLDFSKDAQGEAISSIGGGRGREKQRAGSWSDLRWETLGSPVVARSAARFLFWKRPPYCERLRPPPAPRKAMIFLHLRVLLNENRGPFEGSLAGAASRTLRLAKK